MRVLIRYKEAFNVIEDGDILLFRSRGLISKIIRTLSGGGEFSHIGIASRTEETIELLEFREFHGSRATNLELETIKKPGLIDVYRCCSNVTLVSFNKITTKIDLNKKTFDKINFVKCMRHLLGSEYNYFSIFNIAKRNVPILRWFYKTRENKQSITGSKFICSTSLASCMEQSFFDIFPNKPNDLVTPNDWAENPMISYILTIV